MSNRPALSCAMSSTELELSPSSLVYERNSFPLNDVSPPYVANHMYPDLSCWTASEARVYTENSLVPE